MFSLSNFGRKLYVIFFVFMLAACALLAYCFITCIFFDEIGRRKHSLPMIMMTVYVIVYFRYMDLSIYVVTIAASWLQPVDWFDLYACLLLLLFFTFSLQYDQNITTNFGCRKILSFFLLHKKNMTICHFECVSVFAKYIWDFIHRMSKHQIWSMCGEWKCVFVVGVVINKQFFLYFVAFYCVHPKNFRWNRVNVDDDDVVLTCIMGNSSFQVMQLLKIEKNMR